MVADVTKQTRYEHVTNVIKMSIDFPLITSVDNIDNLSFT